MFLDEKEGGGHLCRAIHLLDNRGALPARCHPQILASLGKRQISGLWKPFFCGALNEGLRSYSRCLLPPSTARCEHILLTSEDRVLRSWNPICFACSQSPHYTGLLWDPRATANVW